MAGKIVADQLEHSTAGTVDTQFVVKCVAKHFINFDASSGTPTSLNSFSIIEHGSPSSMTFKPDLNSLVL